MANSTRNLGCEYKICFSLKFGILTKFLGFNNFFETALIWASRTGQIEVAKVLLGQKGININAKDVYLISSMFQVIIRYFKIIIEI